MTQNAAGESEIEFRSQAVAPAQCRQIETSSLHSLI